jgi:acyl-CoA thioester hydrolase
VFNYRRPAFLVDNVVADVIAERMHGARAFFTTIVRRGGDVIAEVKSTWCCLDATTRKPARLGANVTDRFIARD